MAAKAGGRATAVSPQALAAFRSLYGLDRPPPERFGLWVLHAARFDFGRSFSRRTSDHGEDRGRAPRDARAEPLGSPRRARPRGSARNRRRAPAGGAPRPGFGHARRRPLRDAVLRPRARPAPRLLGRAPLDPALLGPGAASGARPPRRDARAPDGGVPGAFARACLVSALANPAAAAGRARGEGSGAAVKRALRRSAAPFAAIGAALVPSSWRAPSSWNASSRSRARAAPRGRRLRPGRPDGPRPDVRLGRSRRGRLVPRGDRLGLPRPEAARRGPAAGRRGRSRVSRRRARIWRAAALFALFPPLALLAPLLARAKGPGSRRGPGSAPDASRSVRSRFRGPRPPPPAAGPRPPPRHGRPRARRPRAPAARRARCPSRPASSPRRLRSSSAPAWAPSAGWAGGRADRAVPLPRGRRPGVPALVLVVGRRGLPAAVFRDRGDPDRPHGLARDRRASSARRRCGCAASLRRRGAGGRRVADRASSSSTSSRGAVAPALAPAALRPRSGGSPGGVALVPRSRHAAARRLVGTRPRRRPREL